MRCLAPLLLVVVLAACEGTAPTRATNAIAIACDAYSVALTEAARFKDRMSIDQRLKIDDTNKRVDNVCLPNSTLTSESLETVKQGTALLQTIMEVIRGV